MHEPRGFRRSRELFESNERGRIASGFAKAPQASRRGPKIRLRRAARIAAIVGAFASITIPRTSRAEQEERVEWSKKWPRVRVWEVANILVLSVGSGLIHETPVVDEAHWSTPILFDKPIRNFMKGNNLETQRQAALVSDYFYRGIVLAPYIIDNYIVAMGVHENADVALQMTLINLQALGLAGVFSLGAEHAIGRSRPYTRDCVSDEKGAPDKIGFNHCGDVSDNQSFPSGHTAAAFTMASLTCVHHQHLPLYGGGLPDALACATMTGVAATTGILRIVSDRHWTTDVIAGAAVGFVSGYIIPSWLHYGFGEKRKESATVFKTSFGYVAPYPTVSSTSAGLGVSGMF